MMLASVGLNYLCGVLVASDNPSRARWAMIAAVVGNLALLAFFKYANFFAANLGIELKPIHLPLGISFFTFHALSYVIDVQRGKTPPQRSPFKLTLYLFFFPQLIAGPIVRYRDLQSQLDHRGILPRFFAHGVQLFVLGLAKKVLVANTVSGPADAIFGLSAAQLSPALAWFGLACYAIQIYFDFSGYSDMALGLARMFGFFLPENFNHPYAADSVRQFWRRWHISLSTWFRDYLFIPLGGSRGSSVRTAFNLVTVFLLCGLWHGAAWTFVAWGVFHGVFLALERTWFGRWMDTRPRLIRHLYALLVVGFGWVFFRASSMGHAMAYFSAMLGLSSGAEAMKLGRHATPDVLAMLAVGVLFSFPVGPALAARWEGITLNDRWWITVVRTLGTAVVLFLFIASAASLAAGTYNPFIYFRF